MTIHVDEEDFETITAALDAQASQLEKLARRCLDSDKATTQSKGDQHRRDAEYIRDLIARISGV